MEEKIKEEFDKDLEYTKVECNHLEKLYDKEQWLEKLVNGIKELIEGEEEPTKEELKDLIRGIEDEF